MGTPQCPTVGISCTVSFSHGVFLWTCAMVEHVCPDQSSFLLSAMNPQDTWKSVTSNRWQTLPLGILEIRAGIHLQLNTHLSSTGREEREKTQGCTALQEKWRSDIMILWPDFGVVLCGARNWTQWSLWVLSKSGYSMTLLFYDSSFQQWLGSLFSWQVQASDSVQHKCWFTASAFQKRKTKMPVTMDEECLNTGDRNGDSLRKRKLKWNKWRPQRQADLMKNK